MPTNIAILEFKVICLFLKIPFFSLFLAVPCGMWDLSSMPSAMEAWKPNHSSAKEFPKFPFFDALGYLPTNNQ